MVGRERGLTRVCFSSISVPIATTPKDGAASAMFVALGPCRGETPPLPRPSTLKPWVQGCVHSRWFELQPQKNWNNQTSWSQKELLSGWFQATNPNKHKMFSQRFDRTCLMFKSVTRPATTQKQSIVSMASVEGPVQLLRLLSIPLSHHLLTPHL